MRILFAKKVMPKKVRRFFSEEKRHREAYFIKGLLFSCITTEYVFTILITFLTDVWGLKLLDAVLITNLQEGLTSILEFYMLLLADSIFGYFALLFYGTISYCVGIGLLSFSYPQFTQEEIDRCTNNNECPSKHPKAVFYFSLVLITIRKSSTTLCLDEAEPPKPKEVASMHRKEKKGIRYAWFMLVVLGSLVGAFVLPYAPIGWDIEMQVCAYMMGASFVFYWLGTLFYSPVRAKGSPLSYVSNVIISAIRHRHISYVEIENLLSQPRVVAPEIHEFVTDDSEEPAGRPGSGGSESDDERRVDHPMSQDEEAQQSADATFADHHEPEMNVVASQSQPHRPAPALSKGILRCLNKAAASPSCKVQDIENTKKLFGLVSITIPFLMYGVVKSIGNTFFLEQATNMDSSIGSLHNFPLAGFTLMADLVAKATSKIYDLIITRQRSSIRRKSDIIKICSGLVVSIFCCIAAWSIEADRLRVIRDDGLLQEPNYTIPMSVFWLTPQFVLLGAMNGLTEDGLKGFYKRQAPSSMKRHSNALAEGVYGSGIILSLAMMFILKKMTARNGRVGWFADSIDESRLDSFYEVLAVVSAVNGFTTLLVLSIYLR